MPAIHYDVVPLRAEAGEGHLQEHTAHGTDRRRAHHSRRRMCLCGAAGFSLSLFRVQLKTKHLARSRSLSLSLFLSLSLSLSVCVYLRAEGGEGYLQEHTAHGTDRRRTCHCRRCMCFVSLLRFQTCWSLRGERKVLTLFAQWEKLGQTFLT